MILSRLLPLTPLLLMTACVSTPITEVEIITKPIEIGVKLLKERT